MRYSRGPILTATKTTSLTAFSADYLNFNSSSKLICFFCGVFFSVAVPLKMAQQDIKSINSPYRVDKTSRRAIPILRP